MFPKVFPKVFDRKLSSKAVGKSFQNSELLAGNSMIKAPIRKDPIEKAHDSEESSHFKARQFLPEYSLNRRQKEIYQGIKRAFEENSMKNNSKESTQKVSQKILQKNIYEKRTHLIQGVTGSGKTEIYIHLLRDSLEEGRGAILLVPEISLTVQLIQRLGRVFGNQLALLHSGMSPKERCNSYLSLLKGERKIAVGTRSAIFAPVLNPGLIILDEEQDDSFKEHSRPRYDARQIAQKRSQDHNCLLSLWFGNASY